MVTKSAGGATSLIKFLDSKDKELAKWASKKTLKVSKERKTDIPDGYVLVGICGDNSMPNILGFGF